MSKQDTTPIQRTTASPGFVYLLHFSARYRHAGHYLGWSENPLRRLHEHRAGVGATLTRVVVESGRELYLARTWPGPQELERLYKTSYNHSFTRLCPLCREERRNHAR